MKIHPLSNNQNLCVARNPNAQNSLSRAQSLLGLAPKKLRRLPHVFSRVLELPFRSNADVSVSEQSDCFRFVAQTDGFTAQITARTVEIHPGVIKVVVRELGSSELALDDLEIDVWRFRLPETTMPELATAGFVGRSLVVTVPKTAGGGGGVWTGKGGRFGGGVGGGRLVVVQ